MQLQPSTIYFHPEQLKDAGILKAETMQTVYLENQGSKGFALHHCHCRHNIHLCMEL